MEPGGSGMGSQIEEFESSVERMETSEAIDEFDSEEAAEISDEKHKIGIVHGAMVKTNKKGCRKGQRRSQHRKCHRSPCATPLKS